MAHPPTPAAPGALAQAGPSARPDYDLVEVWNDVVDTRQLLKAVILGAVISVTTFLVAQRLLAGIVDSAAVVRAYAMLAGVVGCVASGVIAALLFPPKRVVTETSGDDAWRDQIMRDLAQDPATTLSEQSLAPAVVAEMEELGLRKLFAAHEARATAADAPTRDKE